MRPEVRGLDIAMGVRRNFFRGGKVDILLYLFLFFGNPTQIDVYKKENVQCCGNSCSVFIVRKLCTEQMFLLMSMGILRLSLQSSKLITNLMNFYNSVKCSENTNRLHIYLK